MSHPGDLIAGVETPFAVDLRFVDVPVRVLTNDAEIATRLRAYYAPFGGRGESPAAVVRLVQGHADSTGEWADIERGPGRKVKEAVRDVPPGRLVLKRATGVVMGLWPGHAFAAGDLRTNLNQGINLVNACYAATMMARGHLLLHASAVTWAGRACALAGPPGAGKSTASLHLVEEGFRFLSNDRVLARPAATGVECCGYPKQPRVNPGTLLHHRRLSALLEPADRAELAAMPAAALWDLERKHDVDLETLYGPGTVELGAEMHALVLLKWRRDGQGVSVRRIEAAEGLANLPLYYKDLGAFDLARPALASRTAEQVVERRARFADLLGRVRIVEVTGRPDFPALVDVVADLLGR